MLISHYIRPSISPWSPKDIMLLSLKLLIQDGSAKRLTELTETCMFGIKWFILG
jgi:hypothetical protein